MGLRLHDLEAEILGKGAELLVDRIRLNFCSRYQVPTQKLSMYNMSKAAVKGLGDPLALGLPRAMFESIQLLLQLFYVR